MLTRAERIIATPFRRFARVSADIDLRFSAVTESSEGFLIPLYSATCGMKVEIRFDARFFIDSGTFRVDTAVSTSDRNESNITVDPNIPINEGVKCATVLSFDLLSSRNAEISEQAPFIRRVSFI